jgi:hypothetical protein
MRRLLSICLFAAILLPFLAPLLSMGAGAETLLPACCRRDGKHRCMGMMSSMSATPSADGRQRAEAPREMCPYQQRALVTAHHELSSVPAAQESEVTLLQQPAAPSQAECLFRISFDRSRQKRGPPSLLS